jgi:ABC-type Fe3+ transport system permease subunit
MRITGIIFLVIGVLTLGYLVFDVFDANGRDEYLPFLSQTWAAIISSFTLAAGAALLVATQRKYRGKRGRKKEDERINA